MASVARLSDRFEERTPPANLDLEQTLLGTVLSKEIGYDVISEVIDERHFRDDLHSRIWSIATSLHGKGKRASPASVKTFLGEQIAEGVPTMPYLAALCAKADVSIPEMREDAKLLKDLYVRRQLMAAGKDIIEIAYNPPVESTAEVMLSEVDELLEPLRSANGATGPGIVFLGDAIRAAAQTASNVFRGGVAGLSTGFAKLDTALGNMQAGDLIIIGGRPGSGKTSLGLNIACNITRAVHRQIEKDGNPGCVGFFSQEMTAEQLGARILAEQTGIPTWRTRLGRVTEEELTRYVNAQREAEDEVYDLLNSKIFEIDPRPGNSLAQVVRQCREWKKRKGLRIAVIDYLQLMGGPPGRRRDSNRVQEIGDITTGLKNLAKELGITIILLSQLSRDVEKRDNKRPMMADLRDSGSIEQDADAVLLIYREEYYLRQDTPDEGTAMREEWEKRLARCAGIAEVIVAKSRHGVAQTVVLGFDGPRTCFLPEPSMENRPPPEEPRRGRADRPKSVTADGAILFGALTKATKEKSSIATKEQIQADSMLVKGARLIPADVAKREFAKEIGASADDKELPKRFTSAFASIRKNGDARFTGDEEAGYFIWMPSMVVEL